MTRSDLLRLPGLVDMHVHLRDPGQTNKEDFYSGTAAALSGGYTDIFDMPNNAVPVLDKKVLDEKIARAHKQIVCNVGFYFGSLGDNLNQFNDVKNMVHGLKLYLNATTGNYLLDPAHLKEIFKAWNSSKPILLHAEEDIITKALQVTASTGQATHVCHVSSKKELAPIIKAKKAGLPVTCGTTPHHLFMTEKDEKSLGNFAKMKPSLKTQSDQNYLWEHFDQIDVIESDHAPHTKQEKHNGAFGVPGLETTLPLLLHAEKEGKLSLDDIIQKCATSPRKILGLQNDDATYIEVELVEFQVSNTDLKTKCGWTPFEGRTGFGKVSSVFKEGREVYKNGVVLAKRGSGKVL